MGHRTKPDLRFREDMFGKILAAWPAMSRGLRLVRVSLLFSQCFGIRAIAEDGCHSEHSLTCHDVDKQIDVNGFKNYIFQVPLSGVPFEIRSKFAINISSATSIYPQSFTLSNDDKAGHLLLRTSAAKLFPERSAARRRGRIRPFFLAKNRDVFNGSAHLKVNI